MARPMKLSGRSGKNATFPAKSKTRSKKKVDSSADPCILSSKPPVKVEQGDLLSSIARHTNSKVEEQKGRTEVMSFPFYSGERETETFSSVEDPHDGGRGVLAVNIYSTMKMLDNLDYKSWVCWKHNIELVLDLMDLDIALHEPYDYSARWKRSNRLSLSIMKSKMSDGVYVLVPENLRTDSKHFLQCLNNMFQKIEDERCLRLSTKLYEMKYDGREGNVQDHIMRMSSLAYRVKASGAAGADLTEKSIVKLVVDSLPSEFAAIQEAYAHHKEKWGLDEIMFRCVRREENFAGWDAMSRRITRA